MGGKENRKYDFQKTAVQINNSPVSKSERSNLNLEPNKDNDGPAQYADDTLKSTFVIQQCCRLFMQESNQAVLLTDLTGQIIIANHTMSTLMRTNHPNELTGKNLCDLSISSLVDVLQKLFTNVVYESGKSTLACTIPSGSNHPTVLEIQARLLTAPLNDVMGIMFLARDCARHSTIQNKWSLANDLLEKKVLEIIEELNRKNQLLSKEIKDRKKAQELHAESERLYKSLLSASPDAVAVIDLEGRILLVSRYFLELFGVWDEKNIIGIQHEHFFSPDELEKLKRVTRKVIKESSLYGEEFTFLRSDRSQFTGEVNATLIRSVDGKPKGIISVIRDITERKKTEREILYHYCQLQLLVSEMIKMGERLSSTLDHYPTEIRVFGSPNGEQSSENTKQIDPTAIPPHLFLLLKSVIETNQTQHWNPPTVLTSREQDVLRLFAEGKKAKEIGSTLHISPNTVESHRKKIMKKLGTANLVEMTKYALYYGFTTLVPD